MGWSILLESNQKITEQVVEEAIKLLPRWLTKPERGMLLPQKQKWGWSLAVDVTIPQNLGSKFLRLSGSNAISGDISKDAARRFKTALEKLGHRVEISDG
jgi:hypothetical protein